MLLDASHARQRLAVAGIAAETYEPADAAHESGCLPQGAQFVDLRLNVEELDSLKNAVNEAGNAVEKTEAREISVQKKQNG
jgi:hypothetical protein